MSLPALTRYQRTQARINEILDEIRDNPMATEAEIVRMLAKRWNLNRYTVEKIMQYCKREGMITAKRILVVNGKK